MIKCNELYDATETGFPHPGEGLIASREKMVSFGLELANNSGKSQKVVCCGYVGSDRKRKIYPYGLTVAITKDRSGWIISDWEHRRVN